MTDTLLANHMYGVYTPDYIECCTVQTQTPGMLPSITLSAGAVEAGTVMTIGEGTILQPSTTPYDTHVVGVVSTNPGVILKTKEGGNPGEAMIALTSRVPCKVDASNGPIHTGDLLTTSSVPGHAMKALPVTIGGVVIFVQVPSWAKRSEHLRVARVRLKSLSHSSRKAHDKGVVILMGLLCLIRNCQCHGVAEL